MDLSGRAAHRGAAAAVRRLDMLRNSTCRVHQSMGIGAPCMHLRSVYVCSRHALLLLLPPWWHCMVRLRHERSPRRPRLRPIDRHAAAATAVDGGRSAWIDTCPPPVIAWCVMGGIRAVFSLVGPSLQLRYLASSSFIYSSVCRSIPTGQVTSARTKKKGAS